MTGLKLNIEEKTLENNNFRQVLYTGQHIQLVLMTLKPGEEIGLEVHSVTDQFFRFESGTGKVVMNGEENEVRDGDAVIVPAGTEHNVKNTSATDDLKFYTVYAPPHHKDRIVHKTKSEGETDPSDHL